MNRTVHAHIKSIMPEDPAPDGPVFLGGGTRPNKRFRTLCGLADIGPKTNVETGEEQPWVLKDLRKTCATYYDEHLPESSVEILGHSAGGVTYRHYAHRAPLAETQSTGLAHPTQPPVDPPAVSQDFIPEELVLGEWLAALVTAIHRQAYAAPELSDGIEFKTWKDEWLHDSVIALPGGHTRRFLSTPPVKNPQNSPSLPGRAVFWVSLE